jgi:DNA-directed RNA polymerase subunit alpha
MHDWQNDLIKPKSLEGEKLQEPFYGRFIGEAFERGFGATLGNALRRVLLSSLSGAAVVKVRIKGVLHEFSTVPGVTEDVTDILLNLKEVRFRLRDSDEETVRLDARGEREVTAADLVVGPRIDVLNPDVRIATLGKNARLEMEAVVSRGRGYVTAEYHKSEEDPLGTLVLDAAFSPVRRVNFTVTNARVGQRTDYDRLSLEIWTDGSITPEEALSSAARILQDQLSVFVGEVKEERHEEAKPEPAEGLNENMYRPIEELNLSVRSTNCLQSADIRYVGELVQKNHSDLLKTKNFGRKSLDEITEILHEMGLELGTELEHFPSREELEHRRVAREEELS